MELHEMLRKMVIEKASDLFIKVGSPPSLRIDGKINFLDPDEITPQDAAEVSEIIEAFAAHGLRRIAHTRVDKAVIRPATAISALSSAIKRRSSGVR